MNERMKRVAASLVRLPPVHRVARLRYGGIGSILMFHRVQEGGSNGLPGGVNAINSVEPAFLRGIVELLRDRGIDIVHMEEALSRLTSGTGGRRFACLTFDDGYRDTYEVVYPLLRAMQVPFTVNVSTGLLDGKVISWWIGLESLILQRKSIAFRWRGEDHVIASADLSAKHAALGRLSRLFRSAPPAEVNALLEQLGGLGVDFAAESAAAALSTEQLLEMADDELVEIGAHTVTHCSVGQVPEDIARAELSGSKATLERLLERPVRHMAFPYGGSQHVGPKAVRLVAEAGYATATTTHHGNVFPAHRHFLHALPRLPVDGRYQDISYMDAVISGAVAALKQPRQRVVTI